MVKGDDYLKNICIQLFQHIKYTKAFIKTLLVFLVISLSTLISGVAQMNEYKLDEFLGSVDTCTVFNTIIIITFISVTLGSEFKNKTIYYSIMNGHTRKEVFWGKLIGFFPYIILLSLLQCVIMYSVLAFMTNDIFFDQYINNVILNSIAVTVVYISYSVLSLTFSFISRSAIGGIGGSIIVIIVFNVIFFLLNLTGANFFSYELSNFFGMFIFRYLLKNNADIVFQIIAILVYIILSGTYLCIGYNRFKKDDLI